MQIATNSNLLQKYNVLVKQRLYFQVLNGQKGIPHTLAGRGEIKDYLYSCHNSKNKY